MLVEELTYLERCKYPKQHQAHHIAEVRARISRLRTFANHKPGQVADICDEKADQLEQRLCSLVGRMEAGL